MKRVRTLIALLLLLGSTTAWTEDWPMWRYDSQRSAASPHALPEGEVSLLWTMDNPALIPAWDSPLNRDLMQFDTLYEPIVVDGMMYLASNANDSVTAIDTDTGKEVWTFFTDGPVRFSPVVYKGNVYFTSDDGNLYCVDANTGEDVWVYRSVPNERLVLGNERLISTWPARGGPVIDDGVLYFASGIWPMMGVFIFALDPATGEEIWVNDSCSSTWMKQPHNSPSFASIAPQGALFVSGDKLMVPGGRSVPACFDKKTGEFLYYQLSTSGKSGGAFGCAIGSHFVNYHRDQIVNLYDSATGEKLISQIGEIPVASNGMLICKGEMIHAYDYAALERVTQTETVINSKTGKEETIEEHHWELPTLWEIDADATADLIQAGNVLYAGGDGWITAIRLSDDKSTMPTILWKVPFDGIASRLVAADEKLFVVTKEGSLFAFAPGEHESRVVATEAKPIKIPAGVSSSVEHLLRGVNQSNGYAIVVGEDDPAWFAALLEKTSLRVIGTHSDSTVVHTLRQTFVDAQLHGKRTSFQKKSIQEMAAPSHLAHAVFVRSAEGLSAEAIQHAWTWVRPYGGVLALQTTPANLAATKALVHEAILETMVMDELDGAIVLRREGALPGSDDWTHQFGNIANTVKSDDDRVKLPLGVLWFGGSSNMDVLPRHGHGPPQQVVGGRLFIQGMDGLSARDVYTGRVLWRRDNMALGNYGVYFDKTYANTPLDPSYNQVHIPGANARGTNYVVTEDMLYIVRGNECLLIDPETGDDIKTITLPVGVGETEATSWGYIGVYQDLLIAGADMVKYTDYLDIPDDLRDKSKPFMNYDITSSKRLVVMNRFTGELLWSFNSDLGLRHSGITVGDEMLYCIDSMPPMVSDALRRRGETVAGTPRLLAFDLRTGNIQWSTTEDVFGTWMSVSLEHDILLQATRRSRDMLYGEPDQGLIAYKASTGDVLWKNMDDSYSGPCIMHGETLITNPFAYNLRTGDQVMRSNPITGEQTPWSFHRNYGCNYAVASEHLMTFRSAAAGFYDLANEGGTGNFGGFKSGCTNTLIAANGVLNAPDYTRTCSCSYQNQSSLALIHDPQVELWTYNIMDKGEGPVRRLGLNLGAPGDRSAENGTLWLEYPYKGGPSPEIDVRIQPETAQYYLHHSSRFDGDEHRWVAASGLVGADEIRIPLDNPMRDLMTYTVRLYFTEPDRSIAVGERVFDIAIQGKTVVHDFDPVAEAGRPRMSMVKEFSGIEATEELIIAFTCSSGESILSGIELISSDQSL